MKLSDKVNNLSNKTKVAVAIGAGLVFAPVAAMAVTGMVGLGISVLIAVAGVNVAPVIGTKFANWKLRALIEEATKNPIITMQQLLTERKQQFELHKQLVAKAVAESENARVAVNDLIKKYPQRRDEFERRMDAIAKAADRKVIALEQAKVAIQLAEDNLKEMKSMWEVTQALNKAEAANNLVLADQYAELKHDAAMDSVVTEMNAAFARLTIDDRLNANTDEDTTVLLSQTGPTLFQSIGTSTTTKV